MMESDILCSSAKYIVDCCALRERTHVLLISIFPANIFRVWGTELPMRLVDFLPGQAMFFFLLPGSKCDTSQSCALNSNLYPLLTVIVTKCISESSPQYESFHCYTAHLSVKTTCLSEFYMPGFPGGCFYSSTSC